MDKNRISIIIPVYNAEDYLDRCLKSILSQGFDSFEVILVDDGSTDSSSLICDRYSATDSRFRTIHKKNGGVSSARNAGIDLAKGEYLMFVDSDDALLPDALASLYNGLNGEDAVIGGYKSYQNDVPINEICPLSTSSYSTERMEDFFDRNIIKNCDMLDAPWAKIFRRKAVAGQRFNESLSYAEDKLFVFSFLASCSSVRTVSSCVYAYYHRPGSLGSDVSSDRHLMQLRRFLPSYAAVISRLNDRYPDSSKIGALYHTDLIGRYVCRMLNVLLTRRTELLTPDFLGILYEMMDKDERLGVFTLRTGQVFNLMLWRFFSVNAAVGIYRLTSSLISVFRPK